MRRAIVVEPDQSIRKLEALILRQHADISEIVERLTIEEALPLYAEEHFDFAMIEVSHPSETLHDFLHLSRKRQRSPVIAFTTAELSRQTLELLVEDHVFAVFPKPFELEEVAKSVRAAVEAANNGKLHPKFYGFLDRLHGRR